MILRHKLILRGRHKMILVKWNCRINHMIANLIVSYVVLISYEEQNEYVVHGEHLLI